MRTQFENLRVYQLAEEIADLAWETVIRWDHLPQVTNLQTVSAQTLALLNSLRGRFVLHIRIAK